MIETTNPGMFIILNYTLMTCLLSSVCASLCAAVADGKTCATLGNIGGCMMCMLLMYVWFRLFTWKCK
jgi:hypothetical protein